MLRDMRRLLTPKWLAVHALVCVGAAAFTALGLWQAGRAADGNMLSWAYTFEWPLFAVFLIAMWVREMRLALGRRPRAVEKPERRGPVITRRESPVDDGGDSGLAAYNDYLAWLNEHPEARPNDYRVQKESTC